MNHDWARNDDFLYRVVKKKEVNPITILAWYGKSKRQFIKALKAVKFDICTALEPLRMGRWAPTYVECENLTTLVILKKQTEEMIEILENG